MIPLMILNIDICLQKYQGNRRKLESNSNIDMCNKRLKF